MRKRTDRLSRISALLATCIASLALTATSASAATAKPFSGTALWISQVPTTITPQTLAQQTAAIGVHTLYVKAGDGTTVEPQFTPTLVQQLKAQGVTVCAWTFIYGADPAGESAVASTAVKDGAQCLVIDAEGDYDGRYAAAQTFVHDLRASVGASFPIGLAGQAEVAQHPAFPYSVFLGPGGFNADLPQIYWLDFRQSVDGAFATTMGANAIYGRPISPVGQLYGAPSTTAVQRFRSLAGAYATPGLSFFSLDAAQPTTLTLFATAAPKLARKTITPATIHPGADGDQVVWAQELLNGAGAKLPVGGYFGATTSTAVAGFQTRHHIRVSGNLDAPTWKALLRYHAKELSWAKAPPQSAQS